MEVVRLESRHVRTAADVLAASFFEYPMFTCYYPDRRKRARYLAWHLGVALKCALRYGEAYTTPDTAGVCFILPPDHLKISVPEYLRHGMWALPFVVGLRKYNEMVECEDFVASTHEDLMEGRPHYYLWGLAVGLGQRQRGIGAALMQPVLAQADGLGLPVYLETHDERNVPYYRKHGFCLTHTTTIPRHGLHIWCMIHEPIGGSATAHRRQPCEEAR